MTKRPQSSVVVCTRRREAALERCLKSVSKLDSEGFEVIVVDNTEGDRPTSELADRYGARYLIEPLSGLSRARNTGVEAARGELVAFVDDDAVVSPEWLSAHQNAIAGEGVAVTTGRIIPPAEEGPGQPQQRSRLDLGPDPFRVDRDDPSWFELANFGGIGFGGNIAFRRSLFDAGLRFRTTLGLGSSIGGAEELYSLFSVIRDGHGVAYVPSAIVVHHGSRVELDREAEEIASARRYSAYICLLFAEEPRFRGRLLRYLLDATRRTPRPWRRIEDHERIAPRRKMILAACGGPQLYLSSRRSRRR